LPPFAVRVPAVTDISGPVWIDLEIPERVHKDEFVCRACWLVTHVSRLSVFDEMCVECV
jgi:hypothetical protein